MLRSTALRAAVVAVAVAVGLVCVLASVASAALSFGQTYNRTNGNVTVAILCSGADKYNDMELVVHRHDVVTNYSTTSTNWTITSVGMVGPKNILKLTRSVDGVSDETVVIKGPLSRGGDAMTSLTLNTSVLTSLTLPGFLPPEGPGLSPWGILILVVFLLGAGAFAVTRRRTQVA
jgi:hypothetical protein